MKKFTDFLLSIVFTKSVFSYRKILLMHQRESTKIQGAQFSSDNFLYLLPYKGYIRDLFWSIKFKNNKQATKLLSKLLYETLPEHVINWERFENFTNPLLITVPSSKKRIHKRGFDQNHVIIKSFLRYGGDNFVEYQPQALKKVKNTIRQSRTTSKQERLLNPRGAFAVANAHFLTLKGRNIILFDDILTTGATTQEIKKLLHKAGACQIKIVVIAH